MGSKQTLRLILGDQLNHSHSWYENTGDTVHYVFIECIDESSYVMHHVQKLLCFFGAMRQFAEHLKSKGHNVFYRQISEKGNPYSISENIKEILNGGQYDTFEYQLPDEYRLDKELSELAESLKQEGIAVHALDSEHFLSDRYQVKRTFEGKKTRKMETFYRDMRRKHNILLDDSGQPIGGKWNYDESNREKLPKNIKIPKPKTHGNDLSEVKKEIDDLGIKYFGDVNAESVLWPINRSQALENLEFFTVNLLPLFGRYQDAMAIDEWSVYHSRISFALNTKLISPEEVIQRATEEFHRSDEIPLSSLEGFIRQILGWREYMRGIYWEFMPEYSTKNYFGNNNKLPKWYWNADTDMNCMRQSVGQSLKYAYAHHIQRLMITGNFALLIGADPDEVDAWYLGIYIDAIEWVEITNTRGMSQFADGGIVGTKPYVSSANYINKMSDYCSSCKYDHKKRIGEDACPFNSLYWDFHIRNEDTLRGNHRLSFVYRNIDRMDPATKTDLTNQAKYYLDNIDSL
jgi:deoxyribodipyrimidine photolyase-related protein